MLFVTILSQSTDLFITIRQRIKLDSFAIMYTISSDQKSIQNCKITREFIVDERLDKWELLYLPDYNEIIHFIFTSTITTRMI